jgi:hypothetical protein
MSEVIQAHQSGLLSFIERASKDDTFDVAKFGELLRLQRDTEHDVARRAFNRAMAQAQAEMLPVARSAQNKHLGNRYAKLEDIDREMRPIYTRHGFSVRFGSAEPPQPGWMRVTCTVAHEAGYFEENYLDSPVTVAGSQGGRMAVTPVQAVGSTVTYLRRYLEGMIFNIVLADDDDDGESQRMMRTAAADMPRGARVAERAPAYETPPEPRSSVTRSDDQWRAWLLKLADACKTIYRREEVVQVGERASVGDALANGPPWVQREVSAILAANYARFPEEAAADADPFGEVEINGEAKLAAG